ncbi:hypothetical protein N5U00_10230 [Aliarcobacter butzleri]|uniref:hypothetical protein n=1 Tax=Aliarcobacter butzleri TaxID=28197 RepID=UPI0021B6C565|nr:hypothetical protein [Aliarcobacter butzleri]MCT7575705.1 hypothetical protein [Aliarcobacter butzleri]
MIKYIEHRVWFLGHIINKNGLKKSINYSFNVYSQSSDKIVYKEMNFDLVAKLSNIYSLYYINCEKIKYQFLNNGCVSIIIEYSLDNHNSIFLKNYDYLAGEKFIEISSILFERLEELIDKEFSDLITLNSNMKWGVSNLLIKKLNNKLNYDELNFNSVLYTQNFVYRESDSKIFEEEINNFLDTKISNEDFDIFIDWGKKFIKLKNEDKFSIDFLDSELVYLSKKVMVISQLNIFTHLSQKILYDEDLRNKISVEDLELLVSSYRTLFQTNELISQDFDEFAKKINKKFFEVDNFKDLISLKKNSELTLIQLAKYSELKKTERFNKILQGTLTIIAVLTVYSVINDIASFLLLEENKPIQNVRIDTLIGITVIIFLFTIFLFKMIKKQ